MTDSAQRRAFSMESPVTIGLVVVLLGGIIWNIERMERLQESVNQGYVSRPVFEAEMRAMRAEMSAASATLEGKLDVLAVKIDALPGAQR